MEKTIKDILELAEDDEDMESEAYVDDMFSLISKLFPISIQEKIARVEMKGSEKMAKIMDILESLREDRQNMTKMCHEAVANGC